MNLTTATDRITCPACHFYMEPEYRVDRHSQPAVALRSRCGGCGRLWVGMLVFDVGELSAPVPSSMRCVDDGCECRCHE